MLGLEDTSGSVTTNISNVFQLPGAFTLGLTGLLGESVHRIFVGAVLVGMVRPWASPHLQRALGWGRDTQNESGSQYLTFADTIL